MNFELEFDKSETIKELENYLKHAEGISYDGHGRAFQHWHKMTLNYLKGAFTDNAVASYFDSESDLQISYSYDTGREEVDSYDIEKAKKALRRFIRELSGEPATKQVVKGGGAQSNRVFIVHGHNEKMLLDVKEVLKSQGLVPVILKDEPNGGATIIEKFERSADVGFAVILLTADDIGGSKLNGSAQNDRARQNVILELGYFIGKLGRSRICALNEDKVEIPSDFHGVIYTPLDSGGAWRYKLLDELRHAGYVVDKNKL